MVVHEKHLYAKTGLKEDVLRKPGYTATLILGLVGNIQLDYVMLLCCV